MRIEPVFSELLCTTNYSFLRGASTPQELVHQARALQYKSIGIADWGTFAGVVKAYRASKETHAAVRYGVRLVVRDAYTDGSIPYLQVVAYPTSKDSYHKLCRILSSARQKGRENKSDLISLITLEELNVLRASCSFIIIPPFLSLDHTCGNNALYQQFTKLCERLREVVDSSALLSLALRRVFSHRSSQDFFLTLQASQHLHIPCLATNDVLYHSPERRALQDVLVCIRHQTSIQTIGRRLEGNAEHYLKPPGEIARLFREHPEALRRTQEVDEHASGFSFEQLSYDYPESIVPNGRSAHEYLRELVFHGGAERYAGSIPASIKNTIEEELSLIRELHYEKYFLTCHDIVRFARLRGILCQGRGSAANSVVCFCLGITAVDPDKIDLLFARFVSKERAEPPDIDIDFEHARREEVIQYIYDKYGREHAALTAEVITFRHRSAVREVGKALGFSPQAVDILAKSVHRWTRCQISDELLSELGFSPENLLLQKLLSLTEELVGFPRHFSQHVGGFIISAQPLCELVPILPASMEGRTIIEWDKDDIEELGILKIDILALGMLTCIQKALTNINARRIRAKQDLVALYSVPHDDTNVYDMICRADTLGVFQIESRAQMSMLPRLRPRTFYDLVIEVALVRPGPIQGNMVHPYLKRRSGKEKPYYPDKQVEAILQKTLGIPLFQEQAMRLAIALAGFSPGEAEKLRRSMAAWKKSNSALAQFETRIIQGMKARGYSEKFARTCVNQMKGFSEYGFPESHAASFAHLVYASAWIKHYYPAEFAAALINSQPMGFYAPSQILRDAENHGVQVLPVDALQSSWDCATSTNGRALRLGLRLLRGVQERYARSLVIARRSYGSFSSLLDLWIKLKIQEPSTPKSFLFCLARADALSSLGFSRRQAIWEVRNLPISPLPLDRFDTSTAGLVPLRTMTPQQEMFADYRATALSLRAHPMSFLRETLTLQGVKSAQDLRKSPHARGPVCTAGVVLFRQRPHTAKGVVFITLEDEFGMINLIIPPNIFKKYRQQVLAGSCLLVIGKLEQAKEVIYVLVDSIQSIDDAVLADKDASPRERSYSY